MKDMNAWAEKVRICQKCGAANPSPEQPCRDGKDHKLEVKVRFRRDIDLIPPSLHMG